jgi:hypothetical protein
VGKVKASNEQLVTGNPMTVRTMRPGNSGAAEKNPQ